MLHHIKLLICLLSEACCEMERDDAFGILWPQAKKNSLVKQSCPNGTGNLMQLAVPAVRL